MVENGSRVFCLWMWESRIISRPFDEGWTAPSFLKNVFSWWKMDLGLSCLDLVLSVILNCYPTGLNIHAVLM